MEDKRNFKCFKMERQMLPTGTMGDVLVETDSFMGGGKVQVPLLNIPMMSDEQGEDIAKRMSEGGICNEN